ncbi:hypothetical protein CTheo_3911 [Ceratobasidium theobromae]|uniref:Uncharacterized protein n=1 Tax=Ceratobasidium theobromae TaxID=1582974 RepID=A0A5N5QN19_9AGAM|nr:hypothetical protein CTheo_3911 [Ceratobasidium theobromae]
MVEEEGRRTRERLEGESLATASPREFGKRVKDGGGTHAALIWMEPASAEAKLSASQAARQPAPYLS